MTKLETHTLYDRDCQFVHFSKVLDARTEDYEGDVLYVEDEGDGEVLGARFMLVEDARAYWKRLAAKGWVRL